MQVESRIKSTARPASFPFVRNAGNLLAAWAWTDRCSQG
jgi:hypothetical protein